MGTAKVEAIGGAGLPLGVIDEVEGTLSTGRLESGDDLVLYSDGLTEARVSSAKPSRQPAALVGVDGLATIVSTMPTSPREAVASVITEVDRASATKWAEDDLVIGQWLLLPGIGLITAVTIRAEVGQFDRFQTGKQLAKFCGVTPRNVSSGERQADAGLIEAGNPQLRAVLIELAHRLARQTTGPWSSLARRLLLKGKKKNGVVAAVANRFIRWLYHQMQPDKLASPSSVTMVA